MKLVEKCGNEIRSAGESMVSRFSHSYLMTLLDDTSKILPITNPLLVSDMGFGQPVINSCARYTKDSVLTPGI